MKELCDLLRSRIRREYKPLEPYCHDMPHNKKKTKWKPTPAIETIDGRETWSHTGPHEINDAVVDGELSFDYGDEDEENDDED